MRATLIQGRTRVTRQRDVPLLVEVVTIVTAGELTAIELDLARWPREIVGGGCQLAARTVPAHRDAERAAAARLGAGVDALSFGRGPARVRRARARARARGPAAARRARKLGAAAVVREGQVGRIGLIATA